MNIVVTMLVAIIQHPLRTQMVTTLLDPKSIAIQLMHQARVANLVESLLTPHSSESQHEF